MSVLTSPPQPHPPHLRPPSRSERLLRDTLRRDDTLRTTTPQSRARRSRSACSRNPEEDEDFFQTALLFRSTRPNSPASVSSSHSRSRAHTHPRSCYIADSDEHTSYAQLLRSPSFSGSFREPKSPQYTSLALEKQEDAPPYVRHAPHEAVLRTRLEHVLHLGMREVKREKEREAGTSSIESSAGSPPSSLLSLSSSRHSHESEHTHLTTPEGDAQKPSTPPPGHRGPHFTRSVSSAIPDTIRSPDLERAPKSPRSPLPTGKLSHSPQLYQKQNLPSHAHPSSPRLTTPLPSPSVFATTPTKRASPVMASVDASPPSVMYQTHLRSRSPAPIQSPPRSPPPHRSYTPQAIHPRAHPHTPPAFDPQAASLACQKVPGYVSFASVAGLGAPPDEDDRHSGRTIGLGFGGGKWWAF